MNTIDERRTRRSSDPGVAFQYLIEAVARRSDEVRAVALVGEGGDVIAAVGPSRDVAGIAQIAGAWVRGEPCDGFDRVTEGTDLLARGITHAGRTVYLAALATRVRRMPDAARAVVRIMDESRAQGAADARVS